MPNWVINKVRAKNKDDIQKLISILVKEVEGEKVTNFNGIIPMPDAIRNTSSPNNDRALAQELKKVYGYEDWWHFAVNEWGTKWDNLGVTIDDGVIVFESAWSMPDPIYRKISKTVAIIVEYADEDIGYNFGICEYDREGRHNIEIEGTDAQIANAIWGYGASESVQDVVDDIMDYDEVE